MDSNPIHPLYLGSGSEQIFNTVYTSLLSAPDLRGGQGRKGPPPWHLPRHPPPLPPHFPLHHQLLQDTEQVEFSAQRPAGLLCPPLPLLLARALQGGESSPQTPVYHP